MSTARVILAAGLVMLLVGTWVGCGDDGKPGDDAAVDGGADAAPDAEVVDVPPDQVCPGDPDCPDQGDGVLHAGVVTVDLTPTDLKEGPTFVDVNSNHLYSRQDDEYTDLNDNGEFDAVWISGNEFSRPAIGVHDPIEARLLALRTNETTVVLITADFIGFFYDYVEHIRQRLDPAVAAEVDLIVFASSHNHQGPDVVGIWGSDFIHSGLDPEYLDWVETTLADRVGDAVAALEPARITYGAIAVQDAGGDMSHLVSDTRDPVIINNEMNVLRLSRPADDSTIATVVNFAYHPEVMGSHTNLLSADMVCSLRNAVEDGVPGPGERDGVGGTTLYVNSTVGGQIGAGDVTALTRDGTPIPDKTWEATEAIGVDLADFALRALDPAEGAVTDDTASLSFRTRHVFAQVDNFTYQAAYRLDIFNRAMYHCNPEAAFDDTNIPEILTELVVLRLGRASMITIPGEAHPEVFIGCYDGTCSGTWPIVDPDNPNPPPLGSAPDGPYLKDLLAADGSEYQWVIGLGQDELGYIMPNYNYQLSEGSPYLQQPPGDHYEEVNSLGPLARDQLIGPLIELIGQGE